MVSSQYLAKIDVSGDVYPYIEVSFFLIPGRCGPIVRIIAANRRAPGPPPTHPPPTPTGKKR